MNIIKDSQMNEGTYVKHSYKKLKQLDALVHIVTKINITWILTAVVNYEFKNY